uniref:hypothetical protein n=1 Tax=Mycobacterium sp. HUMS_1102779 TaxID=3383487 RepID=UPI00389A7997
IHQTLLQFDAFGFELGDVHICYFHFWLVIAYDLPSATLLIAGHLTRAAKCGGGRAKALIDASLAGCRFDRRPQMGRAIGG